MYQLNTDIFGVTEGLLKRVSLQLDYAIALLNQL
jgi:hypothetical protein